MDQNSQASVSSAHSRRSPQTHNKHTVVVILLLSVIILLLIGATVGGWWLYTKIPGRGAGVDGNLMVSAEEADLTALVKKVSPSVVSVVTTQTTGQGLFQQNAQGAGTGVIISQDGYIMTNKHVIQNANSVTVVDGSGTQYDKVTVVGVDPLNDLAFLKITDGKDLPAATLGDSGTVRVGQKVVAIGNSLGQYQNTVTSGIVSGLGRPVAATTEDKTYEALTDLLQTDAAINPGNSGGPLLNSSGQVIGINTAIVEDAQSIGFAIPINAAKGLVRSVLATGKVQKAYIGVQYVAITPDVRAEHKLSERQGALVQAAGDKQAVVPGGPADKAGLRAGDIIVKVNDKVVGEQGCLGSLVAEFLPGEQITLTIKRGDEQQELSLTLGEYKT